MALTEIQLPTKTAFYGSLQSAASKMDNIMRQFENIAEFIGFIDTVDLDAMGVPVGQVRTDLVNFREVMNELVDFYNGVSTTQTHTPAEVVDKLRAM